MISKYITENGKFRQIDEFMPGTWINLTAPTQDESLEIARRYNVDLADIRAALDDEESSRVDVNDDYVLILFDIPSVEIRHNQEAYTTIPLGVVWTDDAIITVCSAETPVLKHFIVNNIRDFTTKKQVRFTYQIMYRTSMLYQSYLRIIDRRRLEMEERMGGATEDADIVNLHEMESNLVYFDTSLPATWSYHNIFFFRSTIVTTIQMTSVSTHIIINPHGSFENGIPLPFTFIPYNPDIIVGMDMTIVIAANSFMMLFRRLSMNVDINSRVPFKISR